MEGAWLEMGQGRYELTLNWSRDSADLSITVDRMPELRQSCMADLNDPATYDLRLYPVPRGESIPEAYWDSVQDPIFPAEAMTRDLLEARAEAGTGRGPAFNFRSFTRTASWSGTARPCLFRSCGCCWSLRYPAGGLDSGQTGWGTAVSFACGGPLLSWVMPHDAMPRSGGRPNGRANPPLLRR